MPDTAYFFQFEQDFADSLRCVPMQVRLKLDTCGLKLPLALWNQLSLADRQALMEMNCRDEGAIAAYRDHLHHLAQQYQSAPVKSLAVDPAPPWLDEGTIPDAVQDQATALGNSLTLAQWQRLTPLQRFALIKLSRPSHENHNFRPALVEFGLWAASGDVSD